MKSAQEPFFFMLYPPSQPNQAINVTSAVFYINNPRYSSQTTAPAMASSSSSSSSDTATKAGIGVGVGLGVPILAALLALLWRSFRRRGVIGRLKRSGTALPEVWAGQVPDTGSYRDEKRGEALLPGAVVPPSELDSHPAPPGTADGGRYSTELEGSSAVIAELDTEYHGHHHKLTSDSGRSGRFHDESRGEIKSTEER